MWETYGYVYIGEIYGIHRVYIYIGEIYIYIYIFKGWVKCSGFSNFHKLGFLNVQKHVTFQFSCVGSFVRDL